MDAQTYSLELHDLESICLMAERETRCGFHFLNSPAIPAIPIKFVKCFQCIALSSILHIYIYATPPGESTVFMGVVRANSRNIFEVEDKFSQNNYFCIFLLK